MFYAISTHLCNLQTFEVHVSKNSMFSIVLQLEKNLRNTVSTSETQIMPYLFWKKISLSVLLPSNKYKLINVTSTLILISLLKKSSTNSLCMEYGVRNVYHKICLRQKFGHFKTYIFDFHKKIIIKKIIKSSLNISWTGFSHGLYFFFKIKVDQSKFMNFVEAGEKYCRTKQTGSPP